MGCGVAALSCITHLPLIYVLLFFMLCFFFFFTLFYFSLLFFGRSSYFIFPLLIFMLGHGSSFPKPCFGALFFLGHACFYTWSLGHQKCHCKARYELMITKHSAYWQLASAKSSKIATSSLPNLARQKPLLCLAIITSSSQHTMDGVVKVKNPISWRWH